MKRGGSKRAQRNQALLAALEAGDLAGAQQAVAQGADPRCDDDEPVCVAASTGDLALVRYLIETCGVDRDARDRGVLRMAARFSFLPIVKYLVEERAAAEVGRDPAGDRTGSGVGHIRSTEVSATARSVVRAAAGST